MRGKQVAKAAKDPRFVPLDATTTRPGPHDVALVPGARAPVFALDLPKGLKGAAREDVARRQLRDMTGQGAETLQLRPFHGAAWTRALVADADQVAGWRAQAGPACRAVLPDYLALPAAEGVWTLEADGEDLRARLGPEDGFAAAHGPARLMLTRALATDAPKAALILGDPPDWLADLLHARAVPVAYDAEAITGMGLPEPRRLAHGELAYDLRADPLAERARLRARVLPWRWPVLAGLLAVALWSAAQIIATTGTERAAQLERDRALQQVRAEFVPEGPILDIRAQVSRALADQRRAAEAWRGRTSPRVLLGQAAQVIDRAGAETEELAFGQEQGLIVVLRLADFAAVDRLVGDLRDAGLTADVIDARAREGASGVGAEIRIGEGRT